MTYDKKFCLKQDGRQEFISEVAHLHITSCGTCMPGHAHTFTLAYNLIINYPSVSLKKQRNTRSFHFCSMRIIIFWMYIERKSVVRDVTSLNSCFPKYLILDVFFFFKMFFMGREISEF